MPNTTHPPHERELRLLNELRRVTGYLERGEPQRALGAAKKALNESENSCTKKSKL